MTVALVHSKKPTQVVGFFVCIRQHNRQTGIRLRSQSVTNPHFAGKPSLAASRYRRFTLKTIFIVTAVVAILLALFIPSVKQQWLAYQLSRYDVSAVMFDPDGDITWLAIRSTGQLRQLLEDFDCSHIESLDLTRSQVDSSIAALNQFASLHELNLTNSTLDDQLALTMVGVTAEVLCVSDTKLTANGLTSILDANYIRTVDAQGTIINRQEAEDLSEKYSVVILVD